MVQLTPVGSSTPANVTDSAFIAALGSQQQVAIDSNIIGIQGIQYKIDTFSGFGKTLRLVPVGGEDLANISDADFIKAFANSSLNKCVTDGVLIIKGVQYLISTFTNFGQLITFIAVGGVNPVTISSIDFFKALNDCTVSLQNNIITIAGLQYRLDSFGGFED